MSSKDFDTNKNFKITSNKKLFSVNNKSNSKKYFTLYIKSKKKVTQLNISRFTSFLIILSIICLISTGAIIGSIKGIIDNAPKVDPNNIVPKGYTSIIYDEDAKEIARLVGTDANRVYVDLNKIPKHLQNSFIALEDERFWEHDGIDFKGIFRAIMINLKDGNTSEGASTLTQQLIKNNVLKKNQKTFIRKIQEQYLAIKLEQQVSKTKILENYLNTIALGKGTLGVQAASYRYFNKDVSKLSIAESVTIACITQNPTKYNPIDNPQNNMQKQKILLKKMLQQKLITKEEYDLACKEDVYTNIKKINQAKGNVSDYSYFIDEVIKRIVNDLQQQKGYSESQAYNLLYRGGLSITVTQDANIQKIVDRVISDDKYYPSKDLDYSVLLKYELIVKDSSSEKETSYNELDLKKHFLKNNKNFDLLFNNEEDATKYINKFKSTVLTKNHSILKEKKYLYPQPQTSMVIIDQKTGYVKAIAGGRGKKEGKLTLNRATETTRQPGSTFKVVAAFLPALDKGGLTLSSVFDDVPYQYPNGKFVKNWYDNEFTYRNKSPNYLGLTTIREALSYSMNIVTVKTMEKIGPSLAFDYLKKLGFTTLVEKRVVDGKTYSDVSLPLALGGITDGITNLELTNAYAAIANKGVYTEPIFYTQVLDHEKKVLLKKKQKKQRVIKESTSFLLTNAMMDVLKPEPIGTAEIVKFNNGVKMPIAGKTGTTSNNYDVWFSGFTPYYTASIWMGHDKNAELHFDKASHKLMWRDIMQEIHKNLAPREFERPDGIVKAKICTESGKLATSICMNDPRKTVRDEFFSVDTVPTEKCDVHKQMNICTESNLPASQYCPQNKIENKIVIVRPNKINKSNWNKLKYQPRIADTNYEYNSEKKCDIHKPFDIDSIIDFDNWFNPRQNENKDTNNNINDNQDTNNSINDNQEINNAINDNQDTNNNKNDKKDKKNTKSIFNRFFNR